MCKLDSWAMGGAGPILVVFNECLRRRGMRDDPMEWNVKHTSIAKDSSWNIFFMSSSTWVKSIFSVCTDGAGRAWGEKRKGESTRGLRP
jgi:hypothetical protein